MTENNMGEKQPIDSHALNVTLAEIDPSLDPDQILGSENPVLENTSIGNANQTASSGTLSSPLGFPTKPLEIVDIEEHHLPHDPFNPESNARRAMILAEREAGPLRRFSGLLADIQGSRRFRVYLKDYAAVLGIGEISSQDIRRFKIRADKAYRREPPVVRARMAEDMKRNLELLIEDGFDANLARLSALKRDAGKTQELIEEEGTQLAREFKPARRGDKISILRTLRTQKEGLLISNYELYLRIWQDLNPDGVNIDAMKATFEMAGSSRKQQLALAEKLYADVSNVINQRALAYAAQWKQLSIDQGLPSEMADEQTHLFVHDATRGPVIERVIQMQEIKGMVEELLLKTFGISSKLWAEITTGSAETQYDLDAASSSPYMSIENRIKLAKGIYRKIDRQLKADSAHLFTRLARVLREKTNLGEKDIIFKINRRQAQLKSLSRPEQYKKIKVWLRALGLEPEPTPTAKKS